MRRFFLVTLLVLLLAGSARGASSEILCPPELSVTPPRVKSEAISPGIYSGIKRTTGETVSLPPLPPEKTTLLDNKSQQPLTIGVHRQLPAGSELKWRTIADGPGQFVVRTVIHSPSAVMIRPHFQKFATGNDVEVYVYGDDPETAEGPVEKPEVVKTADFWGPPIRTAYYFIEVVFAQRPANLRSMLPVVDKISHVFKDPLKTEFDMAGGCEHDFTCEKDSSIVSNGGCVAAIAAEQSDTTSFCTGSLLSDLDPTTQIPWFLTARHCQVTASVAPTTSFYFHYQTSVCNGPMPQMKQTTPRLDGAKHIISYADSDFTLLRLSQAVPAGVQLCGWRTGFVGTGEQTYCIHHPEGSFKRISRGVTFDAASDPWPSSTHIANQWTDGVTEPGSSGSPLYDKSGLIIGQLHGGPSCCSTIDNPCPELWDEFGRFSVSWTKGLSTYLGTTSPVSVSSFRISKGVASTNSRTVTLNNAAEGNPTEYMASELPTFDGAVWQPYSASPSFTLSQEGGGKTIYFKVRLGGMESVPATDTITLIAPPSVTWFKINQGAAKSTRRTVTLNNTTVNNPKVYIASENPDFSGATWQPYSSAPSFVLSSGTGVKTVYFKVRNTAGHSIKIRDSVNYVDN